MVLLVFIFGVLMGVMDWGDVFLGIFASFDSRFARRVAFRDDFVFVDDVIFIIIDDCLIVCVVFGVVFECIIDVKFVFFIIIIDFFVARVFARVFDDVFDDDDDDDDFCCFFVFVSIVVFFECDIFDYL